MKRLIDHIVYCVPDLEEAIQSFYESTGIMPKIGGRHLTKGTKNALVNLGNQCYLEFLAIDQESQVSAPRWMGIDLIDEPTITRWSLKSTDLKTEQAILHAYNPDLAHIEKGQRITTEGKMLNWQMSLPLAYPKVELVPFITDWSESEMHPTDSLPEECRLAELQLQVLDGFEWIHDCVSQLEGNVAIEKGEMDRIILRVEGVRGIITI